MYLKIMVASVARVDCVSTAYQFCFAAMVVRLSVVRNWRFLIFVVPCIMLNSEINPTRCDNCVYSSQWLYSTCFG